MAKFSMKTVFLGLIALVTFAGTVLVSASRFDSEDSMLYRSSSLPGTSWSFEEVLEIDPLSGYGWECVLETSDNPSFVGYFNLPWNSPSQCRDHCAGEVDEAPNETAIINFGVDNGNRCWCGWDVSHKFAGEVKSGGGAMCTDIREGAVACPGNHNKACGGSDGWMLRYIDESQDTDPGDDDY